VTQVSAPDWDQTFAVNVRGPFLLARALFRIAEKDPHTARTIVNVSSLAGIRGLEKFPGFSAYTASKHAVIGLTEALTVEGKALGIHVYCVAPGAVDTKMLRDAVPFLKTNTQPEEVAGIIVDLCDPSKNPPATGTILELMTNA
jgi:NAD(P)-dependent dehydrogenase (short-subunit alcohol dehydrogenase family)